MKKKYATRDDRIHSEPEINSGEILVQREGYIPRHRRIEALIEAGRRLDLLKKTGQFDIDQGKDVDIDNMQCDPTREKNFDLADASELTRQGQRNLADMIASGRIKPAAVKKDDKAPGGDPGGDPGKDPALDSTK